jgi:hypothetical protein
MPCDFLETCTLAGTRLYVFAVIEHANRRIRILGATCAVRKLIAAGQAPYLYSLITPPSTRVRRIR